MTGKLLLGALVVLFMAAAPPLKEAKSDSEKLQGTWQLSSVEMNKQPIPLDDLKSGKTVLVATLTVKGESYIFTLGEDRLEMTFKMDQTKTPKTMNMLIVAGPEKGKTYHAIYKLEDDTFTICRKFDPDEERPTVFGTTPDSGLMLIVWKRIK